ncbi:MAG: hypothetical protein WCE54_00015 [Ignavibacteriaceae bacterium]
MVRKIIFLFFAAIYLSSSFAQGVSVRAFTDSSNYQVGDYINLIIQAEHNRNISISNPALTDSISKIEIIKQEAPEVENHDGNLITTFKFIISRYDSGNVTIPPIPVLYRVKGNQGLQTAYTNEVSFTVHTLKILPGGQIKDVKAPIKIPLDWKDILIWVLAALVILGITFYFYLRYKKKKMMEVKKIKKIIQKPPHVMALYELRALEQQQLWQKGMIKEYHSKITEIIRRYFQDQFYLPALELTTSEVMQYLKQVKRANVIIDTTYDFLSNADLVKFAKFKPMASINEEMMKQANEIVEKTRPAPEKEMTAEVSNV